MRNDNHRDRQSDENIFELFSEEYIEMIRWFIEDKHIWFVCEEYRELESPDLTITQIPDRCFDLLRIKKEFRENSLFFRDIYIRMKLKCFMNSVFWIKLRKLRKISDFCILTQINNSFISILFSEKNTQKCTLPTPIRSADEDALRTMKHERKILKQFLIFKSHTQILDREYCTF